MENHLANGNKGLTFEGYHLLFDLDGSVLYCGILEVEYQNWSSGAENVTVGLHQCFNKPVSPCYKYQF